MKQILYEVYDSELMNQLSTQYRNDPNLTGDGWEQEQETRGNPEIEFDHKAELHVARKTANVVLGNAFNKNEGVVVDTHVGRLAQRFGLTKETTPVKIERDLMALFPTEQWTMLSHLLVRHGREVCKKRGGSCSSDSICQRYCSEAATS